MRTDREVPNFPVERSTVAIALAFLSEIFVLCGGLTSFWAPPRGVITSHRLCIRTMTSNRPLKRTLPDSKSRSTRTRTATRYGGTTYRTNTPETAPAG